MKKMLKMKKCQIIGLVELIALLITIFNLICFRYIDTINFDDTWSFVIGFAICLCFLHGLHSLLDCSSVNEDCEELFKRIGG